MKSISLLTTFLLMFSFLILAPVPAQACSCAPPELPLQALDKVQAVFAGLVTDIDIFYDTMRVSVTFDVFEFWKGPQEKTIVVSTALQSATCGFSFNEGEEYLVYAYDRDGEFSTNLCTRTTLLSYVDEDLEELGPGQIPDGGQSPQGGTVPPKQEEEQGEELVAHVLSPEEIIEILIEEEGRVDIDSIGEVTLNPDKTTYNVIAQKKRRLFFFIPVRMSVNITVNAETGFIQNIRKPWWSFLAR